MKTSKKAIGPSKVKKSTVKKRKALNDLADPKETKRLIPEEDDEFEIQLDDDIKGFDEFDEFDDDDDY